MDDADIRTSATQLLKTFGGGAAMEAAHQADKMLQRKDQQGHAVWMRIVAAIRELERDPSPGGKPN